MSIIIALTIGDRAPAVTLGGRLLVDLPAVTGGRFLDVDSSPPALRFLLIGDSN
jgi:hypothetical protein